MWPVSDRFLTALGKPHKLATVATVTPPGGAATELRVKAGRVRVDSSSNYRRTLSPFTVLGGRDVYELLSTPGAVVHIEHGIDFGRDRELVPVFHGEAASAVQGLGDGSVSCRLVDLGKWLDRARFLAPYNPAGGTARATVIADVVTTARPGTTVSVTATDAGQVASAVWDDGPLGVIADLTKDGATEAFFLPDGRFLVRDQLSLTSAPVWTIRPGAAGVLTSAERERPLDKMYNTVVVKPTATDGSQPWSPQVAQVSDPNHPRHPSKIGVVPYVWASPTASTGDAALTAAHSILSRVLGTTETLRLGLVSNPALEAGDVIRVITPRMGQEPADAFTHFIDSFELDVVTGEMSVQTRSQAA